MFTPVVRLLFVVLCIALGLYHLERMPVMSAALLLASVLFVAGYFRNGTIWLACRAMKQHDLDRAERLARMVARPEWLSAQNRAYHALLRGVIGLENGDLEAADTHLRAARAGRLRTMNDRSFATLALAEVEQRRGHPDEARELLEEARAIPQDAALDPVFAKLEERIDDPEEGVLGTEA